MSNIANQNAIVPSATMMGGEVIVSGWFTAYEIIADSQVFAIARPMENVRNHKLKG